MFFRVGHEDWRNTGTQRTQSTWVLLQERGGTGTLSVLQGRALFIGTHGKQGFCKRVGQGGTQDTLLRNTRSTTGHGEGGEAEGQLDLCKSKTPRDTVPSTRRTQMDMGPAKREDTEVVVERKQRNTGCSVGTR